MLFDKIESPRELFTYKLGSALKMEQKLVDTLGDLQDEATNPELKQAFAQHREETRGHVRNVEMAFEALGEDPDDHPDAAVDAIAKQGKAEAKMADDRLTDTVLAAGAIDTEHHEIAVYEALLAQAEIINKPQVVSLLQQNLEQEQHALDLVRGQQRTLVAVMGEAA
jgi:ferritin-like metal-binding protein YciE